jgi:multidrug efflux pump subunit AcrA (membrane-fusion protein)
MTRAYLLFIYFLGSFSILSCHHASTEKEEEETAPELVQTPVTITSVSNEPLTEYAELNATSVFQQDNIIKSNITGYIKSMNVKVGQYVAAGQTLFVLKTKEAESLGNTIDKLDSSYHFSGVSKIATPESGYVTELPHQLGDYVQDGEQLAVISNANSFGFILNLPYELHKYVVANKAVDVILPDSTRLDGIVASYMPVIDSVSQTQQVLIKVSSPSRIPENLIAKVRILKIQKTNTISLPKQAVLSNDAQTTFWVMKMMDSATAVRVPVVKGIETNDRIEILKPQFTVNDKILLTGNYGLPDTARVRVVDEEQ